MPYKTEKIALADPFLKRRVKLLPCQKEMVLYWSNRGISSRKIAAMFNVSKRLIQFIIDPNKHKANLERRKERGGSAIYYKKEANTKAQRDHRKYKNEVLKNIV